MDPSGFDGAVDRALRAEVEALLAEHPDGVLPIVQAGHPVLRTPAAPYSGQLGDLFEDLLEWMRLTMLDAPGVGLAAPQVGVPLAVAVVHDPGAENAVDPRERPPVEHRTLVNPTYRAVPAPDADGVEHLSFYEGCLSVDGYQAVVARARAVELTSQDELGARSTEVLVGWPARIVQHETDHLRGELYLDHAELRSLSSQDNLARWAREVPPAGAAATLGFPLHVRSLLP